MRYHSETWEWTESSFDAAARLLRSADGRVVHLTPKESDCLRVLAAAQGAPVSTAELSARVWNHPTPTMTRTYQQALRSLRRKLSQSGVGATIEAVRGVGYRLIHYQGDTRGGA